MKKVIKWICIFLVSTLIEIFVFSTVASMTDMMNSGEIESMFGQALEDAGYYENGVIPGYSEGLEYELSMDGYYIVKGFGTCTDTHINISPSYKGVEVKEIAKEAFYDNYTLVSVTLPYTITTINYRAFCHSYALESITLNEGLKYIGDDAFLGCPITEVVIPSTVTYIGYQAFFVCSSLEKVYIPSGVKEIRDKAFSACPCDIYCEASELLWNYSSWCGTGEVYSGKNLNDFEAAE